MGRWERICAMPSVLIVDDHLGFRTAARRMLESEGFAVVGEAADGAGGISAARELRPDLVLLDVVLPDGNGFDVAEVLSAEAANTTVVMISSRPASAYRSRLASTSARGFIFKADLSGERLRSLAG
jgi:DNA-binding NarL/FixJ family response regulator